MKREGKRKRTLTAVAAASMPTTELVMPIVSAKALPNIEFTTGRAATPPVSWSSDQGGRKAAEWTRLCSPDDPNRM